MKKCTVKLGNMNLNDVIGSMIKSNNLNKEILISEVEKLELKIQSIIHETRSGPMQNPAEEIMASVLVSNLYCISNISALFETHQDDDFRDLILKSSLRQIYDLCSTKKGDSK